MQYFYTKQGTIINENHVVIPQDDNSPLFADYLAFLEAGGTVMETEIIDTEEFNARLRQEYSDKISNIRGMREALERFAIDGTPIPQEIIDERETLKQEYDTRIL